MPRSRASRSTWDERCDTDRGTIAVPDYFAPECYAPFEGDNGGATATGVTADSIKVVFYLAQEEDPIIRYITDAIASDDTNEQQIETMQNVIRYYESFYETYGRSVELVPFVASGGAADEVAARADAVRIAEEIQPFVVLQGPALTPAFGDELAARGVMCISCVPGQPTEFYEERAPYVWAIDGSQVQKQDHVFEFISKQLIGQPASHAGDELAANERTFGLVYIESSPTSTELANQLATRDGGGRRAARRGHSLHPQPGDDPADRPAGDHPVEDGRRDDGDLQRGPRRATRLHRVKRRRRTTSRSG